MQSGLKMIKVFCTRMRDYTHDLILGKSGMPILGFGFRVLGLGF